MNDRRIGTTLGPYLLESSLGRGGMGTVYLATQTALNRRVAVKLLSPSLAEEPGFVERFRREAVLAANLKHPHIVTVHDFGEDGELLYLVMEYIAGGTLKDRADGPMDPLLAAKLIGQVADALDHAHEQEIVHRDVKPANILLERPEFAKLGDFGIARLAEDSQHLTRTGVGMGTPEYMSPEQGEGLRAIDGRSDIYSLGIVLFDLLTGEAPFRSTSPYAIMRQHHEKPMPVATLLRHGVPPGLVQIVMKATAKRPDQRYSRAGEMSEALETFRSRPVKPAGATPIPPPVGPIRPPEPPAAEMSFAPAQSETVLAAVEPTVIATAPVQASSETTVAPMVEDAPGEIPLGTGLAALTPAADATPLRIFSFIGSRIARLIVIYLVVITGLFFVTRVFSDPLRVLGTNVTPAVREAIRRDLGLNDPLPLQYLSFTGNALRGEFGRSFSANRQAADIAGNAWPMTLSLAGISLLTAAILGIPLAALSALLRRGPLSYLPRFIAVALQSLPVMATAVLLLYQYVLQTRTLPASGAGTPWHFVLPVATLTLFFLPSVMRAGAAFGEAWRGETGRTRRALRAFGGAFSIGVLELGSFVGALIVVETLFAWPGTGRILVTSVASRDIPVVTAAALGIAGLLAWLTVLGGIPREIADWKSSSVALFADDGRSLGVLHPPANGRILLLVPGLVLLTIVLLLAASSFAPPVNPVQQNIIERLRPPDGRHILGTDPLGRDNLDRILVGVRWALAIALGSTIAAGIGGGLTGAIAGLLARAGAGWMVAPLVWIASASRAIPLVVWLIVALAAAGTGLGQSILLISIWLWPYFFALFAGITLEGSRVGARRIAAIAAGGFAFAFGSVLLADGYIGLLGLGLPPPVPTLGGIVADGRQFLGNAFWLQAAGFVLAFLAFTFNVLGDTLAGVLRIRRTS